MERDWLDRWLQTSREWFASWLSLLAAVGIVELSGFIIHYFAPSEQLRGFGLAVIVIGLLVLAMGAIFQWGNRFQKIEQQLEQEESEDLRNSR